MPGFAAHYLFGISTIKRVNDRDFHAFLKKHHTAYGLGLQGPDLFFYYLPGLRFSPNPGSIAHKYKTNAFFSAMLESLRLCADKDDYETTLCYILGFLGHYTLDTVCHPYIYDKTNYKKDSAAYFGKHVYLETDIDAKMLWRFKHMLPSEFYSERTLRLTHRERRAIARCLHFTYKKVFPEIRPAYADMYAAILLMPFALRILHDPYGKKKVFARWIEKHFLGYPYVSPLIASDRMHFTTDPMNMRHKAWKNPWNTSRVSTDSFYDLFEKAKRQYLDRIYLLKDLTRQPMHQAAGLTADLTQYLHPLMRSLANCDYASGLPR